MILAAGADGFAAAPFENRRPVDFLLRRFFAEASCEAALHGRREKIGDAAAKPSPPAAKIIGRMLDQKQQALLNK